MAYVQVTYKENTMLVPEELAEMTLRLLHDVEDEWISDCIPNSPGADRIHAERERQIEKEGYDANHDDQHEGGSLALAAICYAAGGPIHIKDLRPGGKVVIGIPTWPSGWGDASVKRQNHSRIRQLEIAGALIVAEIDRLLRKEAEEKKGKERKTKGEDELDWKEAEEHLKQVREAYVDIGPPGGFALAYTVGPVCIRFDRGERSKELYDEIMELE